MPHKEIRGALRWIIANAGIYGINTDFITVGGASAGAISTVALGITQKTLKIVNGVRRPNP